MSVVGRVERLWRYPVKSMRGEELEEAFVGFSGIYGDRVFAFLSSASSKGFPYLTAREQKEMLRYRPRFRNAKSAAQPVNLVEAMSIEPGVTPHYADPAGVVVDVETPKGEVLSIDDPALIRRVLQAPPGGSLWLCAIFRRPFVSLVHSSWWARPPSLRAGPHERLLGSRHRARAARRPASRVVHSFSGRSCILSNE